MKNFTKYSFLIIGSFWITISCRQDIVDSNLDVSSTQYAHFKIEDGRITFKSSKDFRNQLKELNNLTSEALITWNNDVNTYSLFEVD